MSLKPQFTIVLKYIILITSNIKSACDSLLHRSLSLQSPPTVGVSQELDAHSVRCSRAGSAGSCAVCLCGIEEGDETRELRCKHVFHRECVDRWVERGNWNCPLCRNHLKLWRFGDDGDEVCEEVVVLGFVHGGGGGGGETWWLR